MQAPTSPTSTETTTGNTQTNGQENVNGYKATSKKFNCPMSKRNTSQNGAEIHFRNDFINNCNFQKNAQNTQKKLMLPYLL